MADKDPVEPEQNDEQPEGEREEEKVKRLLALYHEARTAWAKERAAYKTYYRWWAGDHWHDIPRPSWMSKPAPNYIFSTIETTVPILTDGLPRWDASPKNEMSAARADLADAVLNEVWDYNRMSDQIAEDARCVQLYGTDYWWGYYDQDSDQIIARRLDTHIVLPDPTASDFKDANYVFLSENVSLGYIKRTWPEKGGRVKPVVLDNELSRDRSPLINGDLVGDPQANIISEVDGDTRWNMEKPGDADELEHYGSSKQATLVHAFVREKGKVRCYAIAGNVLLEEYDGQLGNDFPFVRVKNYPKDGAWHGASEIEFLENPQKIINTVLAQIIDNMRLTQNPPLLYSAQTGFEAENYVAGPGVAICVNGDVNQIKWLDSPQIDSKLFAVVEAMRQVLDSVSGVHDVTQGRRPQGIQAASAIAELQEAAQTRIRYKFRQITFAQEELGNIVWRLAKKFYDQPRVLRTANAIGQPQFVTLNDTAPDRLGAPRKLNTLDEIDFNIRIDLGAGLPASKAQRANMGLQMYQLGVIDKQALLEDVDYRNRDRVLQRVMLAQQQAAMAQQQAQQQQQQAQQAQQAPAGSPEIAQIDQLVGELVGTGEAPTGAA